jgi:glutaminase
VTPIESMNRVSTGQLPSVDEVAATVEAAYERFRSVRDGEVADYIPALASAPPDLFGISVAGVRGQVQSVGDVDHAFSIQSVSKPFVFALVCEAIGTESARRRLGVNSTGLGFDSVMAVELNDERTMNAMVNAGALAATSLVPGGSVDEKWAAVLDGLSCFAGRDLTLNEDVYSSEITTNLRNRGIAHLLQGYGRLACDPEETIEVYTRQCSLDVTVADLAVMAATLADGGVNPVTGVAVVSEQTCRATLAALATAGLYEHSGDWLFDVGLPGKSGVSGAIVTVAPGKGGMAVFSPRLDPAGNSVRGQLVTQHLSHALGLNLFASEPAPRPAR